MITQVQVENFKRFQNETFTLKPDGMTFLAGGNNSGKTTLLHALAVWEFCRSVIEQERESDALLASANRNAVGINADDFSPIAVPNLKHLWHNLRPNGSALKIRVSWQDPASSPASSSSGSGTPISSISGPAPDLFLQFGLSLSNERLYLKATGSNLQQGSRIPHVAYLPPFAGIAPVEERLSPAARKRLLGRGASGAVLRNTVYDLWKANQQARKGLQSTSGRISGSALAQLRTNDPWERLGETLQEVFDIGIEVSDFNELYHTRLRMELVEMELKNKRLSPRRGATRRDIMVEGSGFLQWLSVYALAVSDAVDVLLLDEPDAHLHPTLQGRLTFKLAQLASQRKKQILLATHSTTILGEARPERIYRVDMVNAYLSDGTDRIALFEGLGSRYTPLVDDLKRQPRLFLYEGPSDLSLLRIWARTLNLNIRWSDIVCRRNTMSTTDDRRMFIATLRSEIRELKVLSLQDRDDRALGQIKQDLRFGPGADSGGASLRFWRRRNIENYLLVPRAIAQASGHGEDEVQKLLQDSHSFALPEHHTDWNCPEALCLLDGKKIIGKKDTARGIPALPQTILGTFSVDYEQIAQAMKADEIADDVKELLRQLDLFARS